jgi:hypothetical protein
MATRTRIYSAPVVAAGPGRLPGGKACTVYKVGAREKIAADWDDWEDNCEGAEAEETYEYSLKALPEHIVLELDSKEHRAARIFGCFDTPELFCPTSVVWEGNEEMSTSDFNKHLEAILQDLEAEGALTAYVLGLGDVAVQLGEALNNDIISRWEEDECLQDDQEEN